MIKSLGYAILFLLGMGATISSSLWGGATVILAFMLNPVVIAKELPLQRYQFYTSIAFICSVLMHPRSRLPSISPDSLVFKGLWLYVGMCFVTSLWATDTSWAFSYALNFSKTVLIAWLLTKVVHDERGIRVLLFAGLIGALHAAFMHTFGVDLDWVSKKYADEWGVLPDMQAQVMLLFLPLFLLIAIMGRSPYEKLLGWVATPIVLNSIVESYQRAYFVGLLAEAVYLMLFLPKRIALRLAPILGTAVLLYVFVLTPENYWSWMDTINSPTQEGSASSRFDLYTASGKMLADNPQGVGYRCYIFEAHKYVPRHLLKDDEAKKAAHSTVCTIACETGVIGFLFWLTAVGTSLWLLRKIRRAADPARPSPLDVMAMGIEIGLYGWLVGGLFHSDHETDPAYWFLGFAVMLYRLRFAPVHDEEDFEEEEDELYEEELPLHFEPQAVGRT